MYSEDERRIYRARVAGQDRAFDPLRLRRRLSQAQQSEGTDLRALLEAHESLDAAAAVAAGRGQRMPADLADERMAIVERVARLGCLAFDVPELTPEGDGWTIEEAALALSAFLRWESELQGEPQASPSHSTSTAGPREDLAGAGPPPTTGPTAA